MFVCGDNVNIIYNLIDEVRYILFVMNVVCMGIFVGLNIKD